MDYSVDFLPIGDTNGDAILLRYGFIDRSILFTDLVDGGYAAIGDKIIEHMLTFFGSTKINNVLLTHADDDHARGLITVLNQCNVGVLYMNRPWLFVPQVLHHFHGAYTPQGLERKLKEMHPYLVELEEIANRKGIPIRSPFQGTAVGCSTILAPSMQRYISLIPDLDKTPTNYASGNPFSAAARLARNAIDTGLEYWNVETLEENPDPTSASNETSVVQLARFDAWHALFTGDAGPDALHEAADYAEGVGLLRPPDLFQIPHQGSRRNVTPSVLNRWLSERLPSQTDLRPGWASCAVGANKKGHPRKKVTNAIRRRGYRTNLARENCLQYYSPSMTRGWGAAAVVPFYSDVREDDDA